VGDPRFAKPEGSMALEFARVHVLSRRKGHSAVAAAAYRAGVRLSDEQTGETFDYRARQAHVVYADVRLPAGANPRLKDRQAFWTAVNAAENGSTREATAQVAKDHIMALPRELGKDHHVRMAQQFAAEYFTARGVPVDVAAHYHSAGNPHAHLLAATRYLDENGFGKKARELNGAFKGGRKIPDEKLLSEHWADFQDRYFQDYGLDLKVSRNAGQYYAQVHLGAAHALEQKGEATTLGDINRTVWAENRKRIQQDPDGIIRAVADRYAVFSLWDLHRELERRVADPALYPQLKARIEHSALLVRMPTDLPHGPFFTTKDTLEREERISRQAQALHTRPHALPPATVQQLIARHAYLSEDQQHALHHVLSGTHLAVIEGVAGSGKSTLLSVAREGWERAGYRVIGVAPTGHAAHGLEASAGIASRTLHAWFWQLDKGRETLSHRAVVVADEAALLDTRALDRLITTVTEARAKLVLVGDSEQLQPIQAGGAYRLVRDQVGCVDLTTVRRQRHAWQHQATRELGRGNAGAGLAAYWEHGHIRFEATDAEAQAALVTAYLNDFDAGSSLILAHRREDVAALNHMLRTHLRRLGILDSEVRFDSADGPIDVAIGERVLFTRNSSQLGVSNGDLGTVTAIRLGRLTVELDGRERRRVTFSAKEYAHLTHGYALTIHKSQGVTVDRAYVLATPGMNKHLTYVALTRHRDDVQVVANHTAFKNEADGFRRLTGAERKITALEFAQRHGYEASEWHTLKTDWERALEAVSANHAVFTVHDLEQELGRDEPHEPTAPSAGDDPQDVAEQLTAIQRSGQLVPLPTDQPGGPYYTTRLTLQREADLLHGTQALQD
jgi:Ti-type conjugative transfer relaxase TraA